MAFWCLKFGRAINNELDLTNAERFTADVLRYVYVIHSCIKLGGPAPLS